MLRIIIYLSIFVFLDLFSTFSVLLLYTKVKYLIIYSIKQCDKFQGIAMAIPSFKLSSFRLSNRLIAKIIT